MKSESRSSVTSCSLKILLGNLVGPKNQKHQKTLSKVHLVTICIESMHEGC